MSIFKVVLTGGPGAGKTSAIPLLKNHVDLQKYSIYVVPEVPTLLFNCGVDLQKQYIANRKDLLRATLDLQVQLEQQIEEFAKLDTFPLIIYDRGIYDYRAYCDAELWEKIFQKHHVRKYDLVIHLVTTAKGAVKEFLNNTTNPARNCTPEVAAYLDDQVRLAWDYVVDQAFDQRHFVDNACGAFKPKIEQAIRAIASYGR